MTRNKTQQAAAGPPNAIDPRKRPISDIAPEVPVSTEGRPAPGPDDEVRARAYERYEARGREDGRADEDWFEAEAELKRRDG